MSGGSMNYLYSKVQDVADQLQFDAMPERRALGKVLAAVAKAFHDIEWVDSCDYGPGDEREAIAAVFAVAGGSCDQAVLAVLIDDAKRINRELQDQIAKCEVKP